MKRCLCKCAACLQRIWFKSTPMHRIIIIFQLHVLYKYVNLLFAFFAVFICSFMFCCCNDRTWRLLRIWLLLEIQPPSCLTFWELVLAAAKPETNAAVCFAFMITVVIQLRIGVAAITASVSRIHVYYYVFRWELPHGTTLNSVFHRWKAHNIVFSECVYAWNAEHYFLETFSISAINIIVYEYECNNAISHHPTLIYYYWLVRSSSCVLLSMRTYSVLDVTVYFPCFNYVRSTPQMFKAMNLPSVQQKSRDLYQIVIFRIDMQNKSSEKKMRFLRFCVAFNILRRPQKSNI